MATVNDYLGVRPIQANSSSLDATVDGNFSCFRVFEIQIGMQMDHESTKILKVKSRTCLVRGIYFFSKRANCGR
jgi:hypothetical protein